MPNYTAQLKADGHLLKRPTPSGPKPKKRIPRVGAKRAKDLKEYARIRKAYLTRGSCEARLPMICTGRMVEIHHAQGRGPNLNNVNTWVGVCRECHNYIHAHPSEARRLGLLV